MLYALGFEQDETTRLYNMRVIFFGIFPLLALAICLIFWEIKGRVSRLSRQKVRDYTKASVSIVLFFTYPNIVYNLVQSVNCVRVEDTMRLYQDIEQICWEGSHLLVATTVSLPGIVGWALGLPALGLFYIRHFRQKVAERAYSTKPLEKRELVARLRLCCGFLTIGYEDRFYYWEVVLMLRKTILVILMVFIAPYSPGLQSLTAVVFLAFCLIVQIQLKPFYDPNLNQIEEISMLTQLSIIYFGLYFQAGRYDAITKTVAFNAVVSFLVLTISSQFLVILTVRLRMQAMKALVTDHPRLFKIVSCGRVKNRFLFMKDNSINNPLAANADAKKLSKRSQEGSRLMQGGFVDPSEIILQSKQRHASPKKPGRNRAAN